MTDPQVPPGLATPEVSDASEPWWRPTTLLVFGPHKEMKSPHRDKEKCEKAKSGNKRDVEVRAEKGRMENERGE